METFKISRLAAVCGMAILASACSEETTPPPDNVAPTLSIASSSFTVPEGEVVSIPFEVSDDTTDAGNIRITNVTENLVGDVSIDMENGVILYTGPWITNGESNVENITLRALDSQGASSEVTLSVTTTDIDSPAQVSIEVPQGAMSFASTRQSDLLNFAYNEGQELTLEFNIGEADADLLNVDYSLADESVIFRNQIIPEANEDGTKVKLTLPVPEIDADYRLISLTLSVDDGDDTSVAVANIAVVNNVELSWTANSSRQISERDGGAIRYLSSEPYSYPAEYEVSLKNEAGEELDFDVNYSFEPETGTISFSEQPGFLGDRTVVVHLTVSNEIPLVGGDSYLEETKLSRTVTFLDDRDDDFSSLSDRFYSEFELLEKAISREDEKRVASLLSSYLYLEKHLSKSDSSDFLNKSNAVYDMEALDLVEEGSTIAVRLSNGESGTQINDDILKYLEKIPSLGSETRAYWYESLPSEFSVEIVDLSFPLPSSRTGLFEFDGEFSHYIGNESYGFYSNQSQTDWEFNENYAYLNVVDFSDTYCF
jgi:hypothetical protein